MVLYKPAVMAGSPVKLFEKRLVRDALMRGALEGRDPADFLVPYAEKLKAIALEGENDNPTTLAAIREVFDRFEGKPKQTVENVTDERGKMVDAALLGAARELLNRLPKPRVEKVVVEQEPLKVK